MSRRSTRKGAIEQDEQKARTPTVVGWRTEAVVLAGDVHVTACRLCTGATKRTVGSNASDSLRDYAPLIASIVRLMLSAWQAFGAQKHIRHRSCLRASSASR